MKLLRETIRRILLENQQHYEKLSALICTGVKESVVQAVELLEAAEYADVEYTQHKWHSGIHHVWKLRNYDQAFAEELERQHQIRTGIKIIPRFSITFHHQKGLIAIGLSEVSKAYEDMDQFYQDDQNF